MVTKFGKFLRKLRIDRGLILKVMADDLGVSSAYLSAIELGKRNIPDSLITSLSKKYNIVGDELVELKDAAISSQSALKIDISNANEMNKETLMAFARKFNELDKEQLEKINKMLKD